MTEITEALPKATARPASRLPGVSVTRLAAVAVLLGLWANLLFINNPLGLSAPVFAASCVLALLAMATLEQIRPAWHNGWLALPLLYFAAMVAVRADTFSTLLNLGAALLLTGWLVHLFVDGNLLRWGALDYVVQSLAAGFEIGLLRPIQALEQSRRERVQAGGMPRGLVATLRGLALAAPVLIIFTLLLTSADAAFSQVVRDSLSWIKVDNVSDLVGRTLFTGAMAWVCLGALAYALRPAAPAAAPAASTAPARWLGFTEAAIVLVSVNLLFAAFVGVQFRYFFGGQSNITVAGFTYSDYARRGFAELVIVAVFTLALGLALQFATRRAAAATRWAFNGLTAVLVVLTGIILASAFQRLRLYEEAYGFTQLRTYPHMFMVWVGVLLAIFLITVLLDRPRLFALGLCIAALGFVATLDVLDTDGFIAQQNIARYAETGKLDAQYLATLSDDATPYLVPLLDRVASEDRNVLGGALHYRLDALEQVNKSAGWPGWHLARARAYQSLDQHRAEIETFEPRQYFWQVPMD